MERGNLARAEKVPGADRLLEDQIGRKDRCGAAGHRVSQLLETDALAAQIRVGELFLRWRRLAPVGDAVRERSLLRGKQQQRQQSEKEASQFHVVLDGALRSVARWRELVRTQVTISIRRKRSHRTP